MSQKTYVPKSKAKLQQTKIGDVLRLGFHAETLISFAKHHQNSGGYINLDIVPRRETDQYGNTHSVVLNDWNLSRQTDVLPDVQPSASRPASSAPNSRPIEGDGPPEIDDIPF